LEKVYVREYFPSELGGEQPKEMSFIEIDNDAIDLTSIEYIDGKMNVRLNDKENIESKVSLKIGKKTQKVKLSASDIQNVTF
nr:hypothetical protein [Bacteroidales bacterium]